MENEESSLCVHLDYFDRLFIACIVCSMHVNTRMKTIINRNEPPADFYQLFSLFIFTHTHTRYHIIRRGHRHSAMAREQNNFLMQKPYVFVGSDIFVRINRRSTMVMLSQQLLCARSATSDTFSQQIRFYSRNLSFRIFLLFFSFFFWLKMIIQFDFGHRCGWWRWNWYFDDILIVCCCVLIPSYM